MNKATFLINWLEKEPLKFSEMNRLMKSVKKGLHGGWEIESKWRGGRWKLRRDYQGYWNTSLCRLRGGDNPLIEKDENGRYTPTKRGLDNRLHPFKRDKKTLEQIRKSGMEMLRRKREWKENNSHRIIEFVEFENADYKLIKKVRIEDI